MGRTIKPARMSPGSAPAIRGMPYVASGQTFGIGAIMVYGSGQLIQEAAATPTTGIVGVTLAAVDSNPGFQLANANVVYNTPTGREQEVSVAVADNVTIFSSRLVNNSATAIAPVQANVGVKYGLSKWANAHSINEWAVDTNLTGGSAAVEVIAIDTTLNVVFFRFLAASIA